MSTTDRRLPELIRAAIPGQVATTDWLRGLSLLSTLGLVGAFTAVMYSIADVAGTPDAFLFVGVTSLLGATVLARFVSETRALALGVVLLVIGLGWYILSLSYVPRVGPIVESNVALLTGQSLNQIRQSGVWVLGVAPTPVFVTWYLALRRYYGTAALVGGGMLGYLVLTRDATWPITLLGVVGAGGMLGFGDLDRRSASLAGAEHVAIALAIMVTVPLVVSVVPADVGGPITPSGGDGGGTTIENSLLEDNAEVTLGGSVDLSPAVRFAIESPVERYWKTMAYDRYTGDGWVRTGGAAPLGVADLPFPDGPRQTIRQSVEVESQLQALPAAWRPVAVDGDVTDRVVVTEAGSLLARPGLQPGDSYAVTSAIQTDWEPRLGTSRDDAPAEIRERYTTLPQSTPDRVGDRAAEIIGDAPSAYTKARSVEQWLEANRNYSLEVDRPTGDVADAFLFEMDAGYCTYFATTMVVMLRSEDVPARLATGYATGQQVEENRWVVRGLDAHAWVEVYVDDVGWVAFDPTPAGPRQDAEIERIEEARANEETDVDTAETRGETPEEEQETDEQSGTETNQPTNRSPVPGEIGPNISVPDPDPVEGTGDGGSPLPELPPNEHLALGLVVLAGAIAGLRRSGAVRWLRRTATVAWQRRVDPETDVKRAFDRVSILLSRRHRPRRPGETVRQYMDAIEAPPAARRVAAIRERARYAETVDPAEADEAVTLADELRSGDDPPDPASRGPNW